MTEIPILWQDIKEIISNKRMQKYSFLGFNFYNKTRHEKGRTHGFTQRIRPKFLSFS